MGQQKATPLQRMTATTLQRTKPKGRESRSRKSSESTSQRVQAISDSVGTSTSYNDAQADVSLEQMPAQLVARGLQVGFSFVGTAGGCHERVAGDVADCSCGQEAQNPSERPRRRASDVP